MAVALASWYAHSIGELYVRVKYVQCSCLSFTLTYRLNLVAIIPWNCAGVPTLYGAQAVPDAAAGTELPLVWSIRQALPSFCPTFSMSITAPGAAAKSKLYLVPPPM